MSYLISSHRARLADDPIFALNREAVLRHERGESIVNATVGTLLNDDGRIAVLPTTARAMREVSDDDWAAYAPIAGSPAFLRAVQDDVLATMPEMRAASVAVATPGGSGALRLAIDDFLEPHQALLTTDFFWSPYQTLTDVADRRLATFSMFTPSGGFDVDSLDRALAAQVAEQGRVLLCINDPCHNPTGYSMTSAEWAQVVERCAVYADRAPFSLLVDMAYSAYSPRDPRAFLREISPLFGKAALLFAWSASKTFTHYGLRVGALIACARDSSERAAIEASLSYGCRGTWSNCNRGGFTAITRLLTDDASRRACDAERDVLKAMLHARVAAFNARAVEHGLKYPRYEGGFFVTVFSKSSFEVAARMRDLGIFVVPIEGAIRVALCSVAERDVPRLVDGIARSLSASPL